MPIRSIIKFPFIIHSLCALILNNTNSASWKATAIGRNSSAVIEQMEKVYKDNMTNDEAIRFAVKGLLEVVESGSKNIELVVLQHRQSRLVSDSELAVYVAAVEKEREEESAAAKKHRAE